jgi:hypothetical protein
MTFTTQKQIWEHLIANEGKPCLQYKDGDLLGLKDGRAYSFTVGTPSGLSFQNPQDWQPYTEPEKCWIQKRVDEVMRPLTASEDSVVKYQMGAEHLAREAIERIEQWYEKELGKAVIDEIASVKIIKNLIGDSDGK